MGEEIMAATVYGGNAVTNLVERYIKAGGQLIELEEGTLGYGLSVLFEEEGKLKTIVIKEVYLNEGSSGHTVRAYNKCPDKYRKLIEKKLYGDEAMAQFSR